MEQHRQFAVIDLVHVRRSLWTKPPLTAFTAIPSRTVTTYRAREIGPCSRKRRRGLGAWCPWLLSAPARGTLISARPEHLQGPVNGQIRIKLPRTPERHGGTFLKKNVDGP